jgi:hypothetical protein
MNVWSRIRTWLCRPPKRRVNEWDVAASAGLWGLSVTPLVLVVGASFGRPTATAALFPGFALAMVGFWLRTGRHWHPIENLKKGRGKQ